MPICRKRQFDGNERSPDCTKALVDLDLKISTHYDGYRPSILNAEIDVIDIPLTEEEKQLFFKNYLLPRKPCKIRGVSPEQFPIVELRPRNILKTLPSQEILTIEKKSNGGFGSGTRRLKMSFGQFIEELSEKHQTDLYLTTQYYEDDPNNSDYSTDDDEVNQVLGDDNASEAGSLTFENMRDDFDELENENGEEQDEEGDDEQENEYEFRLRELYQPPMTNLVESLPEQPDFLKCLIPQQINIWIGAVSKGLDDKQWLSQFDPGDTSGKLGLGRNVPGGGSSSGLHHDHADNIYIPVSGHKRFTLFSPVDAAKMYTVGNIRTVFDSGVIDYINDDHAPLWRQLRDDGAILAEVYKKFLESGAECTAERRKEYELFIERDVEQQKRSREKELDPPSFSTVPTAVVHLDRIEDSQLREKIKQASLKRWPLFFKANRIVADVKPGEMLFLPTGWFHEVTSFSGDDENDLMHVAANYWFIPPNGKTMGNLYSHEDHYWPDDYKLTQAALDWARSV